MYDLFARALGELANLNLEDIRTMKVTCKRQFTIPKIIYEKLGNPEQFQITLVDDVILMKPIRPVVDDEQPDVYTEDIRKIVQNVLKENLPGEEMLIEIFDRVKKYDSVLERRMMEFDADIAEMKGTE